jgi:putative flippase GtrA
MRRTVCFLIAGVAGFLVDAGVLQLLTRYLGVEVHAARVVSFLTAVFATWQVNRRLTFGGGSRSGGLLREWWRYLLSSMAGGAVNYLAFAIAIAGLKFARDHLYVGVAIGSVAGMLVNFMLYSTYVFRPSRRP